MKKIFSLTLVILLLVSCKKNNEIIYPVTMDYGNNVLACDVISGNHDYSFGAKLKGKAELKIVLTNLSADTIAEQSQAVWFYTNSQGWTVSDYTSDGIQTFTSNKKGDVILKMIFGGNSGSCKVEYYENSSTVTKTKILNW